MGLPNAGKSSLFTALTGTAAEAANYPFTTIEPNLAVVPVADERLDAVARIVRASNVVPDTIAFHGEYPRDRRHRPCRARPQGAKCRAPGGPGRSDG